MTQQKNNEQLIVCIPAVCPAVTTRYKCQSKLKHLNALCDPLGHSPLLGLSAHEFVDFFNANIAASICITS
jgi:hypothetical protein